MRVRTTSNVCNSCSHALDEPAFVIRMAGNEAGKTIEQPIGVCSSCALVQAQTRFPQGVIDAHYAASSLYSEYVDSPDEAAIWKSNTARRFAKIQDFATLKQLSTEHVFEFGCAGADNLAPFQAIGSTVGGCDLSHEAIRRADRQYGIEVQPFSVYDIKTKYHDRNDVVIISHVLEHMHDLPGVADALKHVLKPGGFAYIEVPCLLGNMAIQDSFYSVFTLEHVNYFTHESLASSCVRLGLQVLDLTSVNIPAPFGPVLAALVGATTYGAEQEDFSTSPIQFAQQVSTHLADYKMRSEEGISRFEHQLAVSIKSSTGEVAIWGSGAFTQRLIAMTSLGKRRISHLVDSSLSRQGAQIWGIPINHPDCLVGFQGTVVVGSSAYQGDIIRSIEQIAPAALVVKP
jgi:2-polyprenyl-3-methyl-5-hydroxy-6-metoxy-1,4-benzoquinol methylase